MAAIELPVPRDWQVFEDFCRDLFAAEWDDPETQKHGRPGQKQDGVDVYGRRGGRWQGVQCKLRRMFPEKELKEDEVVAEVEAAKKFEGPLETLVVATTAPPDTRLQALARRLTDEHGKAGPKVVVYGWSELCEKLQDHDRILRKWQREIDKASPAPRYTDDASRALAESLDEAYRRHEELTATSAAPAQMTQVVEEILDLKRRLREGGQLKAGDCLGDDRFKLIDEVGRGGFASVFKAYDRKRRRPVAVKVLHGQWGRDRSRKERFFRGARKMRELQHQAIVGVFEEKLEDGEYYFFVMEYVEGGDLRSAVRSGRLGGESGLSVIRPVAEALSCAHERGIIHRDVKPGISCSAPPGRRS